MIKLCLLFIERKISVRFLGVIIDEKLSWSTHIATRKTKMARYIGILCKIRNHLPTQRVFRYIIVSYYHI